MLTITAQGKKQRLRKVTSALITQLVSGWAGFQFRFVWLQSWYAYPVSDTASQGNIDNIIVPIYSLTVFVHSICIYLKTFSICSCCILKF